MDTIIHTLDHLVMPLHIGSYYLIRYAVVFAVMTLFYLLGKKLRERRPFTSKAILAVLTIVLVEIALFDNPFAWGLYAKLLNHEDVGYRESDVIAVQRDKYRRSIRPAGTQYLAVGSSQVGAIFWHWAGADVDLKIFSVAGMKPLDYILFREEILRYNPRAVILYLSEFDLAIVPQLETIQYGPRQGMEIFPIYERVGKSGLWPDYRQKFVHIFWGEVLAGYKYSYVLRGIASKYFGIRQAYAAPGTDRTGLTQNALSANDATMDQIRQFTTYLNGDAIAFNMECLKDFIAFCKRRGIHVIIIEGQYNPLAYSAKAQTLNADVRQRLQNLPLEFENVHFLPRSLGYAFEAGEYRDISHVVPEAASRYTRQLSTFLGKYSGNPDDALPSLVFAQGWYARENYHRDWIRWSDGEGRIDIEADGVKAVVLRGDINSFLRPNTIVFNLNGKDVATVPVSWEKFEFRPLEQIRLTLKPGKNILRVLSRNAARQQGNDARTLAVAVRNLRIALQ